jgi:hypothetical protein
LGAESYKGMKAIIWCKRITEGVGPGCLSNMTDGNSQTTIPDKLKKEEKE